MCFLLLLFVVVVLFGGGGGCDPIIKNKYFIFYLLVIPELKGCRALVVHASFIYQLFRPL